MKDIYINNGLFQFSISYAFVLVLFVYVRSNNNVYA